MFDQSPMLFKTGTSWISKRGTQEEGVEEDSMSSDLSRCACRKAQFSGFPPHCAEHVKGNRPLSMRFSTPCRQISKDFPLWPVLRTTNCESSFCISHCPLLSPPTRVAEGTGSHSRFHLLVAPTLWNVRSKRSLRRMIHKPGF